MREFVGTLEHRFIHFHLLGVDSKPANPVCRGGVCSVLHNTTDNETHIAARDTSLAGTVTVMQATAEKPTGRTFG